MPTTVHAPPPLPSLATRRYHGLDALRAVAMLLGLWLHGAMFFVDIPELANDENIPKNAALTISLVGIHTFRMQLFFALAGFFAALLVDRRGWWPFARNRTLRVVVPLFCGALTIAPVMGVFDDGASIGFASLHHLWFLYYLLYMYLIAWVVAVVLGPPARLARLGAVRPVVSWMVASRARVLFLALPATVLILPMGGFDGGPGETGWMPVWPSLVYYTFFFGAGWAVFWCKDRLSDLTKGWLLWTLVGTLVFFPVALAFLGADDGDGELTPAVRALGACVYSLTTASLICGLTGGFLRLFSKERPGWRYVSDASYWLYLVHLPLQILGLIAVMVVYAVLNGVLEAAGAPALLPEWAWALVMFVGIQVVTLPIMLLTYHFLVRPTFVGWVLNGRRVRRAKRARPANRPRVSVRGVTTAG